MKDFAEGILLGIACSLAAFLFFASMVGLERKQFSYEQIHKGEVTCTDLPDGKVYCYEVKNKE